MRLIEDNWDRFSRQELKSMWSGVIIAVICMPIYMSPLSPLFGLLVSPYLAVLVFRASRSTLLPLILHVLWGSQQRYLLGFFCLVYCFLHFDVLIKRKVIGSYIIYLLTLPFFIWYTWQRYKLFGGGIGAGGTFNGLGYYLAFAPFFWAVASRMSITKESFWGMCWAALLFIVAQMIHIPHSRFIAWAMNMMPVLLVWMWMNKFRFNTKHLALVGGGCVFFAMAFVGLFSSMRITFTQIGVVGIACGYLYLSKHSKMGVLFITPLLMFALTWYLTFYGIENRLEMRESIDRTEDYSELKMTDFDSLKKKLVRKAFDDRAPLWTAAWDGICRQYAKDPVWVDPLPIAGEVETGGRRMEIRLMAHNIALLLLQEYGIYGGLFCYLIYITLFSKTELRRGMSQDFSSPYAVIAACCIGHAIIGGWTGQYVMNIEFSFVLFGLLGCAYGHYYDLKERRKMNNYAYPVAYQYSPA